MPPTISVTVGTEPLLPAAAALDPVAVELLELLQAARPAARAAMLATPAILVRERLDIWLLLLVSVGVVSCGCSGCESMAWNRLVRWRRRLRTVIAAARTAGAVPAGRSGPPRSAPGPR